MTALWLPPELWKEVFAHATYFQGECDIHEWIQRTHPGSEEQTKLELARRQIAGEESNGFMLLENPQFRDQQAYLRLSLILVCRDWFQMTAEHFYRSIIIRDPSKLHGCVKTLKRLPWVRKFVRRLEFSISEEDTDLLDSRSISAFQRQLTDVIEYCAELVFFRGSVSFEDARMLDLIDLSLRSALANHCPNLQLVVGHHALDGYPASTFFRHIPHLSNLVILQLPPNVGTLAVTHKPPVSLPYLRVLDLGNQAPLISIEFGRYLSRWNLPSLDTVHLGTLSPALALHSFWGSHGSKLTTIKVYNAQGTTMGRRFAEVNLGITMPSNDLFPNIRQLIVLHNPPRALTHLFCQS
ncbi:SubName: Full=Uncharacterized protein {ECO:0000313/EMBL:CCA74686.1} [Serendipita indica DSM 11827]|nr:SubName: Full=Uncharacterized protein {ECO:0000313/EMBL:CCA74686.1} [Serendipita indica DSM 11827]